MVTETPAATFLPDFLAFRAQEQPADTAWMYLDRTWTWAEAWDGVKRFAGGLKAEGIERGDRVAFLDKNNPAILQAVLGGCLLGSATAIVNWRLAGDELDYVINDSGSRIAFVGHELADAFELIRDKLTTVEKVIIVGGPNDEFEAWLAAADPIDRAPEVTRDDMCVVMYSSGTTGRPKGVTLTQHNLVEHTVNSVGDVDYSDGDLLLVAMPMFHVGGTSYAMSGPAQGIPAYIIREVDAGLLAGAMMAGATHAFLVPAVVAALLQAGPQAMGLFSSLKVFCYGAAPMPLPILRAAMEAWPNTTFMQVYGMTEMAGVATILDDAAHRDESHPERLVSAGKPIPGMDIRVVDPGTLDDVETGASGEIWFRTEQATPGYLGKPEASAELLTSDGWLRTGDIGRVDDGGFVFIEDRVKDMIISGG
ncbi:MAG: AMP-binding protein, partial [Aeromicrobium sp.]